MSFSEKPVLSGEKTLLRPFTPDDVPVMTEILGDPEVLRLTGSPDEELGPERLRSWYGTRNDQPDRLDLGVVDRATGELVGEVVLHEWDRHNHNCVFRILIGPRGRDRGRLCPPPRPRGPRRAAGRRCRRRRRNRGPECS